MSMSTELLGVDAADLAATIHVALERLARAVDADRAYVLKTNGEGRSAGGAFGGWGGGGGGAGGGGGPWEGGGAAGIEQRNPPIPALPMEAQRFGFRTLRSGEVV